MALTAKELTAIEDQLNSEKLLVAKCRMYAELCSDPQLRQKCEAIAGKHKTHNEALYSMLQNQ